MGFELLMYAAMLLGEPLGYTSLFLLDYRAFLKQNYLLSSSERARVSFRNE